MIARIRFRALAALALLAAAPAHAQLRGGTAGSGVYFQGFDFGDGLQVEAANLVLIPFAYQQPLGQRFSADLYTAFARGAVLIAGTEYTMSGFVDTRVRGNFQVTPWALVTLGLNLPTGNSGHTNEEAHVATVLATELLGFREASWGLGAGVTTGLATAHQLGDFGVGVGASYRLASEFEPVADSTLTYSPGNEVRLRVALDRNIGASKLTAGVTFQNYSEDQVNGTDLFQPGNRWRGDVTYSFRTGPTAAWTAYFTDLWRAHGDVFVPPENAASGETTTRVGSQNLMMAGLVGSARLFGRAVQPSLDFRRQTREDAGGEGWLAGGGAEFPLRAGSFDVTPGGKLLLGSLQGGGDESHGIWGGELSLAVRWGAAR